jgi:Ribonuclease G/E
MAAGDDPGVRIRGIYATALTEFLRDGDLRVVDPSEPIAARFETTFPAADPAVAIDTTGDRLGVSVAGEPDPGATVTDRLASVGTDVFTWTDPLPEGAIVDGMVADGGGRGAIVDLGGTEGYLPDRATDGDCDAGDPIRVQVRDPVPPWADSRPHLDTTIRAPGGLATLVRGVEATVAETPRGSAGRELARTTEILPVSIPANWGVEWSQAATDADMETLEAALARVVDLAHDIDGSLELASAVDPDAEDPVVARPLTTRWVRFGRDARFAMDDHRAAVTDTIAGHHRIKAGGDAAASAVDFVEALGGGPEEFPFGAVTAAFGPVAGDEVRIVHAKPDGDEFALGRGTVTDRTVEKARVTVERELSSSGTYDAIGTEREPGDTATTRFAEGRWWYPTVYRSESGESKGTYVNVATPVEIFPSEVRYVDLYVDVVKRPDGTVEVVDREELDAAREAGHVPEAVAAKAVDVAERVAEGLE